ncbi:DUF3325 domain-containing protein [Pseudomonas sp. TE3610]
MMLIIGLLCYAGFTGLCLGMERHYRELVGRPLQPRISWGLRLMAVLLLAAALWLAVGADGGWSMGLVHWFAALMASVMVLVFVLPYRPRLALGMAAASVIAAPLLGLAL